MLRIKELNCSYGRLQVMWDVSIEVGNESVGLFGPNGAGKTTLVNAVVGLVKPISGEISFNDKSLLPLAPHQIIHEGISVVPQERELFPGMSVSGNLALGAAYILKDKDKINERMEFVFGLFPVLKGRLNQLAGTLSGGEQRMLAIGRALMADPKLLILDEPSLGLQPSLVSELLRRLKDLKGQISILLVEQNVRQSLKAIDRGYVIENGRIVLEGDADGLSRDERVRESYLGL
jgi:branched-chain amino acid transport system ATP-binding protein